MGETIVLPKSGVVLTIEERGKSYTHYSFAPLGEDGPCFGLSDWQDLGFGAGANGQSIGPCWDRDECIAWLDARVLETRAALTPPGHVLVGMDAREAVARELWEFNRACEWTEATEEEKTDYLLGADAVLRAIGVRGGA